jgi:S-formylglutathione hydrolase
MAFTTMASIATFGGTLLKLTHDSEATGTPMALNVFLPAQSATTAVPVLIYLSGLTCSPDNCAEKGFLNAAAAEHGIAVVYPDTSPRELSEEAIPELRTSWTFGEAAGFYVDARKAPYSTNFRMETYVTKELPRLLWGGPEAGGGAGAEGEGQEGGSDEQQSQQQEQQQQQQPQDDSEGGSSSTNTSGAGQFRTKLDGTRVSICGHSMGGHGALSLYLRYPGRYRSVSAWAPVANPINCPWGQNAFGKYFGGNEEDRKEWKNHDATELVGGWKGPLNCLIDQGKDDKFYQQGQLLPENFEAATERAGLGAIQVRYHPGYDHSYYFISTFAADHVRHAAKFLFYD